MATPKKNSFITAELEFAELQLKTWKDYIIANPIAEVVDRRGPKELPNGKVVDGVIATKEQVIKSVQETMDKYLKMLAVVDDLRAKEEAKASNIRGGTIVPARMTE